MSADETNETMAAFHEVMGYQVARARTAWCMADTALERAARCQTREGREAMIDVAAMYAADVDRAIAVMLEWAPRDTWSKAKPFDIDALLASWNAVKDAIAAAREALRELAHVGPPAEA